MEILRIPTSYSIQIQCLSDEDCKYVFKTLFELTAGMAVELEFSPRWGIVQSIWRECIQLENKARAKKWWEVLCYDLAPMVQPMVQPKNNLSATKSNQIKSNQTKPNQTKTISKDIVNSSELSEPIIEFWNKEINWALDFLKKAIGIDDFKESKPIQRQFGNHIVKLRDKIWNEDLKNRIIGIVSDPFKRKNCNSIKYLYWELKSFVKEDEWFIPKAPKLDSKGRNLDRMEQLAKINIT